jgi:DNA-binding NtrC family response regulator
MGLPEPRLTERAVRLMADYDWPGNIRELQHVIERAVILGRGNSLPLDLRGPGHRTASPSLDVAGQMAGSRPVPDAATNVMTVEQLRELEMSNYRAALRQAGGRIYGADGAAALLGIPPTTLASRLKSLGILTGESRLPTTSR